MNSRNLSVVKKFFVYSKLESRRMMLAVDKMGYDFNLSSSFELPLSNAE